MHFDRCSRMAHSILTPSLQAKPISSVLYWKGWKINIPPIFPYNQGGHAARFSYRYKQGPQERLLFLNKKSKLHEEKVSLISLLPDWEQPTLNHIDEGSIVSTGKENMDNNTEQMHQPQTAYPES